MASVKTQQPRPDTTTTIAPSALSTFHRNARRGDVTAIAASLKAHGQYKPISVNIGTHTGRANEVLAGNHTLMAFRDLAEKYPEDPRWEAIKVHWVDVDDDLANRIVVADNRTSELGDMDTAALAALLDDMGDDFDGLGFTETDVADILAHLDTDPDLPDGQPGGKGTGDRAELWGTTLGEPDITPEAGSVWKLGHHHLAVTDLHRGHADYVPLLTVGCLLLPYPTLLAPFADKLTETPAVMVQPDPFMAGWLLTKWNRLRPGDQAVQV